MPIYHQGQELDCLTCRYTETLTQYKENNFFNYVSESTGQLLTLKVCCLTDKCDLYGEITH